MSRLKPKHSKSPGTGGSGTTALLHVRSWQENPPSLQNRDHMLPATLVVLAVGRPAVAETKLGISGTSFTLSGEPTFLHGISYYGALGASDETLAADLDEMQRLGINWFRLWANWAAFGNDVGAVDAEGNVREGQMALLEALVGECDRRGIVVDVTLSRGNGVAGPIRLQTHEAHLHAVEDLVTRLKPHRNWYLDLSNERNIQDKRHTTFEELAALRARARELDADRLVAASHAGDTPPEDLSRYLLEVDVDFIAPHRPRNAASPAQTEGKTREYLSAMERLGCVAPVHYQEPFRRSFGRWQPEADDFVVDFQGAVAGGAAGWCLHNGDTRAAEDGQPRRSFDMRGGPLFDRLDEAETEALRRIAAELQPRD